MFDVNRKESMPSVVERQFHKSRDLVEGFHSASQDLPPPPNAVGSMPREPSAYGVREGDLIKSGLSACTDESSLNPNSDDLYIIARQPGAENPNIPTWASRSENPARLSNAPPLPVNRKEVAGVPGTFQLLNVLAADECERLIALTERLGYS